MDQTEYKTRFIKRMTGLGVDDEIALGEYEAHIESNPNVWEEDPVMPEDDADEAMGCWSD